jgi:ribonuclease-3
VSNILDLLQERLAYIFSNRALLVQALTHRSYGSPNNERLEFLGDAIVDLLVGEFLYHRYPAATEGELSHMRAQVVCGESLAELGQQLQLGDCLHLGAGEAKSGGHRRESSIANAIEALVAAVYLDGGMDVCRVVTHRLFAPVFEQMGQSTVVKDPKTRLQEYLQSRHLLLPEYSLLTKTGNDHNANFTMQCEVVAMGIKATATAASRKKAEQLAAKEILVQLEPLREQ